MKTANNVYINRRFNCSIHGLFKWITEPDLICQWFGPLHLKVKKVKTDFTIGGKYSIELLKPDGNTFYIAGKYIEIEKPIRIIFSFKYVGMKNAPPDSVVEIILEEVEANISRMSLVQKFEIAPIDMINRTRAWEDMFLKLEEQIMVTNK